MMIQSDQSFFSCVLEDMKEGVLVIGPKGVEIIGILALILILKKTSLSIKDMGIGFDSIGSVMKRSVLYLRNYSKPPQCDLIKILAYF